MGIKYWTAAVDACPESQLLALPPQVDNSQRLSRQLLVIDGKALVWVGAYCYHTWNVLAISPIMRDRQCVCGHAF